MKISFKRVGEKHYRHTKTGVEFRHYHKPLGAGRFGSEWVVTEEVGGQPSWISTLSFYKTAREVAVKRVEELNE